MWSREGEQSNSICSGILVVAASGQPTDSETRTELHGRCGGDDCSDDREPRLAAHLPPPSPLSPAGFCSAAPRTLRRREGSPAGSLAARAVRGTATLNTLSASSFSSPRPSPGLFPQASTLALARKPGQPPVEITRSPRRMDVSSHDRRTQAARQRFGREPGVEAVSWFEEGSWLRYQAALIQGHFLTI